MLKQNKVKDAAEHARWATKGAYEADKALDALNDAIQDKKQMAEMKKEERPAIPQEDLRPPIQDLQNAENSLNQGKVQQQATQSLQDAAQKLNQMAKNSMQNLQNKLAQQNKKSMPSPDGQTDKGNERQGDSAKLADGALADAGNWKDINSTLTGENEKGQKTQYSTYYRKANKEYLRKISQESKKWE